MSICILRKVIFGEVENIFDGKFDSQNDKKGEASCLISFR